MQVTYVTSSQGKIAPRIIHHTFDDFLDFHLNLIGHFMSASSLTPSSSFSSLSSLNQPPSAYASRPSSSSRVMKASNEKEIMDGHLEVEPLEFSIPSLPVQRIFISEGSAQDRIGPLQKYIRSIIALPHKISRSPLVLKFLKEDGRQAKLLLY